MKHFPLHSLTMRIWTIFIILTTVIISAISLITLTIINKQNESNQVQNLLVGHETIIQVMTNNNNAFSPSKPPRMDSTDFRHIQHLLISASSSSADSLDIFPLDSRLRQQEGNLDALGKWFFQHLNTSGVQAPYYKDYFNGKDYLFVMSAVDANHNPSYLVSYVVLIQDNSLFYFILLVGILFIII